MEPSVSAPNTLEQAIARNKRKRQLQERRRKMRMALHAAEDRGREHQWRRIMDKIIMELFLMDNPVTGTIHDSHMPLIRFRMDNPSADLKGRVQKLDEYTDPSRNDRGHEYSTAWHQVARQIMEFTVTN